jgi:hypothetical protein
MAALQSSAGSLLSDPIVAGLSDLIGRKRVMLIRPVLIDSGWRRPSRYDCHRDCLP